MLNNLILVGRVASQPKIKIFDDGAKVCSFELAVDRPFKSQEGTRDTDFFSISVWQGYADAVYDYCGQGSIVGVKGRLTTRITEIGGMKIKNNEIVGERVAFINTIRGKDKEPQSVDDVQVYDDVADINEAFETKEKAKTKKKEEKE